MYDPAFKKFLIIALIYLIFTLTGCYDNSVELKYSPIQEYTQVDFEPAWSHSSAKFTYIHSNIDSKFTGIYIANSDGSNAVKIVSDFARTPDWSPDDSKLIFSQFDDVYRINISGDSLLRLTSSGKNLYPKWSGDTGLIAYSSSSNSIDHNIMLMNADGSQKRLLDENANYPEWIAGTSSLIYFKPVKNSSGIQTGDTLVRYSLAENSKQIITVLNGSSHLVNMYPVYAGDRYIFCSADSTGSVYIYSMDPDGISIVRLTTEQSYSPDYSFINNKIIYTNRSIGNGRLWTMDKNGQNKIQITF